MESGERLEIQVTELVDRLPPMPDNIDFLYGLADYYLKRGLLDNARRVAERMVATHPDNPLGNQILNYIYRNQGK